MANQPQSRPWFRLATLARPSQPPAPAPSQVTQDQTQPPAPPFPRPTPIRPTFRPLAPSQAQTQTPPQPAPQVAQPPAPRAVAPPPSIPAPLPYRAATTQPPGPTSQPPPGMVPSRAFSTPASPPTPPPRAALPSPSTRAPQQPSLSTPPSPMATAPPKILSTPASPVTSTTPSNILRNSPSPAAPSSPSPASPFQAPPSLNSSPQSKAPSIPSVPSSPSQRQAAASPATISSPVRSPIGFKAVSKATSPVTAHVHSANESPRAAKPQPETPPQSPKAKLSVSPPSPFSLPPSQLKSEGERQEKYPSEAQQKRMLVQENVVKPKHYPNSFSDDSTKGQYAKPKGTGYYRKSSDGEDSGPRVITVAGENKGAVMELGYSPRRHVIPHGYKLKSDGELSEGDLYSANDRKSDTKEGKHLNGMPMRAFMNSNVQGVNSSILFNSTCTHHDPGVHVSLARKNGHAPDQFHREHSNGKNNGLKKKGNWFSN